jgi:PKD repeat protein
VIADISSQKVAENGLLTFTVSASDPDKEDAGKITLSADGLPKGANFNAGKFSWTPNYDQAGDYTVTFKAKDVQGLEDSKSVTITVTNVNRAPKLSAISNQNASEGKELSFKVSANDEDKQDQLTFTMSGAPSGANLSSDGSFSWTPQIGQAGTYTITVTVSDGTASDSKNFSITVAKATN